MDLEEVLSCQTFSCLAGSGDTDFGVQIGVELGELPNFGNNFQLIGKISFDMEF